MAVFSREVPGTEVVAFFQKRRNDTGHSVAAQDPEAGWGPSHRGCDGQEMPSKIIEDHLFMLPRYGKVKSIEILTATLTGIESTVFFVSTDCHP